jgi:hypothetical protein
VAFAADIAGNRPANKPANRKLARGKAKLWSFALISDLLMRLARFKLKR